MRGMREETPRHGAPASGPATLALPEPIIESFQSLPTPRHSAPSTVRAPNTESSSPKFLTAPENLSGGHPCLADFGLWQQVIEPLSTQAQQPSPVAAAGIGSVRADTASTPGSCPESSSTVNSLVSRVKYLEKQLSDLMVRGDDRDEPAVQGPSDMRDMREGLKYSRGCVSKTRFFGQSHFMNAADMLCRLVSFAKKFEAEKTTHLYQSLEKCKNLGRLIKSRRTPAFNTITIGKSMPSRAVADSLIDAYLRTFESVQRIIHIPTFKADYERYWENPSETNDAYVVLIQLCMAIGATFHDERFTLRTLAIQWFWEGMFWLMTPCEKSRMTVTGLQIRCLMHYLRQTANVGCDLSWIGAGSLLRTAMYMGMHRDPKWLVKMSPYRAEIRRRIWATILEIVLQTSIDAGGAPLISTRDYDTEPPANLDDDQLVEGADSVIPVPKADGTPTQMTVPLALLATFPVRLAVITRTNHFRSDTIYEETLRYSNELNASLQKMMTTLKSHPTISQFALRYVLVMTYRLFFALHQPIIPQALRNPIYYFSRKVSVDTALRISEASFLTPEKPGSGITAKPSTVSELDFWRLTVNGAGAYRSVSFQSVMTIGLELIHQKEEELEHGSFMSINNPDMRGILDAVADWSRLRIQSGETNIKGHALSVLLVAHLDVLEKGINDDSIDSYFEKACEDRVLECHALLLEVAGDDVSEEGITAPDIHDLDLDFYNGVDMLGDLDWDNMDNGGFISNLNFGNIDMLFA
ncbi:C6 zinc finger domain-containing protein [Colletotrichum truncatum]|uniref:C6 zinc finger domain-containing protein n=1 Tax=Colletotrichum truncatum TaxID=5467 RepID=A0ACC3ZLC5_COLTU